MTSVLGLQGRRITDPARFTDNGQAGGEPESIPLRIRMPSFKVGNEGSELVDNPVELLGALEEYGAQIVRQELKNEVALTIATGAGPGEEEAPETE